MIRLSQKQSATATLHVSLVGEDAVKVWIDPDEIKLNEELALQWEFAPPQDFKYTFHAVNWAEANLPVGQYFEVRSKDGRVWFHGQNKLSKSYYYPRGEKAQW